MLFSEGELGMGNGHFQEWCCTWSRFNSRADGILIKSERSPVYSPAPYVCGEWGAERRMCIYLADAGLLLNVPCLAPEYCSSSSSSFGWSWMWVVLEYEHSHMVF